MPSYLQPAVPERRIGADALARLLGSWAQGGSAYAALADGMRRAVLDGTLPLGTRLPSERELADALDVSRTTTGAAYQRLRELGFLATRRGSGSITTLPSGPRATPEPYPVGHGSEEPGEPIDLSIAAPSAPPELHGAAVRALEVLPRYLSGTGYRPLGLLELRTLLAERYTRRGTPTDPDEILVTSGGQQALSLILNTLVGPGDRVVVEHPGYPNAINAVRGTGARPVPVPVGPDGLDLDLLESTVRQTAPRVVLLTPDHHNPTGLSLDDAARERVRDVAARYRTLVIGDETLTDLTLDGPSPHSFTGPVTRPGVVAVGSASKSFWGGLRIGWIRGHRELVARLSSERPRDDIGSPVLEQLIVCELLRVEDTIIPALRSALRVRRDTLLGAIAEHLPWHVPVPPGGLSTWVDLGAPVSSALSAVALPHGVRIAPGPVFSVDGSFENRIRMPFSLPPEQLVLGVRNLAAAWQSLGLADGPVAAGTSPSRSLARAVV